MSFFKKLKDEFKELMGDDKDKKTPSQGHGIEGQKDFSHNQLQQYPDSHQQPQQQYQGPPPTQNYGQPPPQGYGQPPSHGYGQPPQGHGGPPQGSNLPPGWVQQWDAQSQRWYYLDQSTGRSQWDPPIGQNGQVRGYGGAPGSHGYAMPSGQHDAGYATGHHATTYGHEAEKKKGIGKGGLVAAGVGGVAVGALGAAALSGDSSDDEHHGHAAGYGAPASGGYYSSAPAPVPLENNPNLSSSQRSSLESAREDLEEAQAKVRSGSASSSDVEDLREAREEYREEVEEAHEELYDD